MTKVILAPHRHIHNSYCWCLACAQANRFSTSLPRHVRCALSQFVCRSIVFRHRIVLCDSDECERAREVQKKINNATSARDVKSTAVKHQQQQQQPTTVVWTMKKTWKSSERLACARTTCSLSGDDERSTTTATMATMATTTNNVRRRRRREKWANDDNERQTWHQWEILAIHPSIRTALHPSVCHHRRRHHCNNMESTTRTRIFVLWSEIDGNGVRRSTTNERTAQNLRFQQTHRHRNRVEMNCVRVRVHATKQQPRQLRANSRCHRIMIIKWHWGLLGSNARAWQQ